MITEKKKKAITVAILSVFAAMFAVLIAVGIVRSDAQAKREEAERVKIYGCFYDMDTDTKYHMVTNHIESSALYKKGLRHSFKFLCDAVNEKTGQRVTFMQINICTDTGEIFLDDPGEYRFSVDAVYGENTYTFTFKFVILPNPELRPEMRFDVNGGEEITQDYCYRYEYDGQEHYPVAYGWYDGNRLDDEDSPSIVECICVSDSSIVTSVPRERGIYRLTYKISRYKQDPSGETYRSVSKVITVVIR